MGAGKVLAMLKGGGEGGTERFEVFLTWEVEVGGGRTSSSSKVLARAEKQLSVSLAMVRWSLRSCT